MRGSRRLPLTPLQAATLDVPPSGSNPTHEQQYDEDYQDDAVSGMILSNEEDQVGSQEP